MIGALHTMANSKDTTIKTFEFKLRTNKCFVDACGRELEHSRQIYNARSRKDFHHKVSTCESTNAVSAGL
jgi:hypothetical protein